MRTWCVVVLLSFVSVCRAAPLTCEKLLTPGDQGPNLSGRWHLHALSTDSCALSTAIHTLLKPSVSVDFTLKETPQHYEVTTRAKLLGYCVNDTESYSFDQSSLINLKTNQSEYKLLSTSCSDCVVSNVETEAVKALFLYSRQKTISAADLKEFETQAACLKLPSPQVLNTDYEYVNCKDFEDNDPNEEELTIMKERLQKFMAELITCMSQYISSWIQSFTA